MWTAARIAAFLGDRNDQGLQLDDLLPDGPRHLAREGRVGEADRRSCFDWTAIVPKPAATHAGLGKTPAEIANHGQFAFLGCDLAKTRDNPKCVGKKFRGSRQ